MSSYRPNSEESFIFQAFLDDRNNYINLLLITAFAICGRTVVPKMGVMWCNYLIKTYKKLNKRF